MKYIENQQKTKKTNEYVRKYNENQQKTMKINEHTKKYNENQWKTKKTKNSLAFICRHLQWPNCTSYIPEAGAKKTATEQIKIHKNT